MGASFQLSTDRLQRWENFGHSIAAPGYGFRPTHPEQIAALFAWARQQGLRIALRGAGRSYGDPHLAAGHLVLDLTRMNRVLDYDPERGLITVEPGVTIQRLWEYTLEDGWWPAVVPGTMAPTVGGCLAANVHGKNHWRAGTFGDHVRAVRVLFPNGEERTLTPANPDFRALVSSMGTLGVFTRITIQLHRVHSGDLLVEAFATANLRETLTALEEAKTAWDYLVAWVDSTARGPALGRGQIHLARYLRPEEEPHPYATLRREHQVLPATILFVPKSTLWRLMHPFMHNLGLWAVNTAKFWSARLFTHHKRYRQSHVAFNFLLDYVPHWERAYGPGGLIQYQCFVPRAHAESAFAEILRTTQRFGLPTYLGVIKRHRADDYLFSHGVDGFSLAMDFKVTRHNRARLLQLATALDRIVLEAGGRFYFAKDATLLPQHAAAYLGEEALRRFFALKARWDPDEILQPDLYRRVLRPLRARYAS